MKKSILFGISLWVMAISLSSCGMMGGLNLANNNDGVQLSEAISRQDFLAIASQNPAFMQAYNHYADSDDKKKKVMAFAADIMGNIEKKAPGTSIFLYTMLTSKDKKLVATAIETAIKQFDEEVFAYAGTLEPEKVFNKIFNNY